MISKALRNSTSEVVPSDKQINFDNLFRSYVGNSIFCSLANSKIEFGRIEPSF